MPTTEAGSPGQPQREAGDLALRWSGRVSLTRRILAVNIVALLMLAGGFFYLDSYRSRLIDSRVDQAAREARLMGEAIATSIPGQRDQLIARLARETHRPPSHIRPCGRTAGRQPHARRQEFQPDRSAQRTLGQNVAGSSDASIDAVVGARRLPAFHEHSQGLAWPSVAEARASGHAAARVWRAPDRTAIITAAAPLPDGSGVLLTANNERDITWTVRAERFRLSMVLLSVTLVSVLLSLFLARTIVRPIRRLARAAVRVRLGRAREVVVPRLPSRRDEIGMLARALSDMSLALRARIDATDAFAADVTHEIKNPLASLRSAVEGLERIADPDLQARLIGIVRDDVRRLDRLITDISEASRLDAQLTRTRFVAVDLGTLLAELVAQRDARGVERDIRIRFDHVGAGAMVVLGDGARLERVFENLLDNAVSFSPAAGIISVNAFCEITPEVRELVVRIDDEGPGVPEDQREAVFRRFQSIRPSGEAFGQHSGLGLAIARTIVEGHQGSIMVESREDRDERRPLCRAPAAGGGGLMAPLSSEVMHATAVAIAGRAVLIEGASGSGKSDLALRLIDRGARLIVDDRTLLVRTPAGLVARPPQTAPASLAGRMEVRGIGIATLPHDAEAPVALLVRLEPESPRLPERRRRMIAGIEVRVIVLDPPPRFCADQGRTGGSTQAGSASPSPSPPSRITK